MMTLYTMPGACSLASHIALRWSGAQHAIVRLTHATLGDIAYLQVNSKGAVPALKLEDGTVITESLAVLEFIGDTFPERRLSVEPGDARGRALVNERLAELVSDVQKAWAPVFVPDRYVTRPEYRENAKHAAFAKLHSLYLRMNDLIHGRDWLLFGRHTVADAYLHVMCRWNAHLRQDSRLVRLTEATHMARLVFVRDLRTAGKRAGKSQLRDQGKNSSIL